MNLDATTRVSMLETMILARRHEQTVAALGAPSASGVGGGEAVGVGIAFALALQDRLVVNHRQAAALLARGADVADLVAEQFAGSGTGYVGDPRGALHRWAAAAGVLLTTTLEGSELSLASGAALAQRAGKPAPRSAADGGVTIALYEATPALGPLRSQTLALAILDALPLLLISTSRGAAAPATAVEPIDGSDVEAVYRAVREALRALRAGAPARALHLHVADGSDAVADHTERLLRDGVTSAGELGVMHQRAHEQVAAAMAAAIAAPPRPARPRLLAA